MPRLVPQTPPKRTSPVKHHETPGMQKGGSASSTANQALSQRDLNHRNRERDWQDRTAADNYEPYGAGIDSKTATYTMKYGGLTQRKNLVDKDIWRKEKGLAKSLFSHDFDTALGGPSGLRVDVPNDMPPRSYYDGKPEKQRRGKSTPLLLNLS